MIDEKIVPIGTEKTVDWSAFRREAAKDILCAMIEARSFISAFVALVIFYQALRISSLKQEVEHQRKIAETTQDIFDGFRARCIKEEYGYTVIRAQTAINLEDGIEGVKTRLASKLSNELLRNFEPSADRTVRGEKIYSLTIKAKKL